VSTLTGISLFSPEGQDWLRQRTGDIIKLVPTEPAGDSLFQGQRNTMSCWQENNTAMKGSMQLPDLGALKYLLELFDKSPYKSLFPVVDTELFQETISEVYFPGLTQSTRNSALGPKISVLAFFVFASALNMDGVSGSISTETYASQVRSLLPEAFVEHASLELLQGFVIVVSSWIRFSRGTQTGYFSLPSNICS
jgi:hypothetical protein